MTNDKITLIVYFWDTVWEPDKVDIFGDVKSSELKINYLAPIWLKI